MTTAAIPVLRPQLPEVDKLLPYLRGIDERRIYANWGPLVLELQRRLDELVGLRAGSVAVASSGTAALVGTILASAGRAEAERPLAIVPAYTFTATALAAEQCGYRVHFVDVDPDSWTLLAAALADHPALERAGVVIPVAPYGRPVPQRPWVEFTRATGIPVVIDGAACIDRVVSRPGAFLGAVPVTFSFHATKSLAMGEGGGIACDDTDLVASAGQALNFGFDMTRETMVASTNGKLSEYHAAVGLAELDGWQDKLARLDRVLEMYAEALESRGLADRLISAPQISSCYLLFRADTRAEAKVVQSALERDHIEWRIWYGEGLHVHAHFAEASRDALSATERIAPCLIGIPLAPDLSTSEVRRVASAIGGAITHQLA